MKHLLLAVYSAIILLSTFNNSFAAVAVPLARTGQAICYDAFGAVIHCAGTGQDGEMKAGSVWPDLRFTDNGDQTISDKLTGLIWVKDANVIKTRDPLFDADYVPANDFESANDGFVSWQHALDYVKKLNAENYLGHADWRLPNTTELESLINIGSASPTTWLTLFGFTNVEGYGIRYWTGTTLAGGSTAPSAWYVEFGGWGTIGTDVKSNHSRVWPVRSGASGTAPVPKTGQTGCFNGSDVVIPCDSSTAGQDGALQMGVDWPSSRFRDNGNQTVNDNLTGLMWTKNANLMATNDASFDSDGTQDGAVTWQRALDYVKWMNNNSYFGYRDWRLPNRSELESKINRGEAHSSTWLLQSLQGFTNVQSNSYWSSSTSTLYYDNAWNVNFNDGTVSSLTTKSGTNHVWPVRDATLSSSVFKISAVISAAPLNLSNLASGAVAFSASTSATFECSLDGVAYSSCTSPYSYSNLANGQHTFSVRATDSSNAGNVSTPVSISWKVNAALTSSVAVIVPKTGQSTCYDTAGAVITCTGTGQDGEIKAGLAWPTPRFVDNSIASFADKSVTDNLTGLIWTKSGNLMAARDPEYDKDFTPSNSSESVSDGLVTWQHALDYVKKLNTENYLGHNDWRLPNPTEFESLINKEAATLSVWLNGQGLTNIQTNYWSGTTLAAGPGSDPKGPKAWSVNLGGWVGLGTDLKSNVNAVWPVRSRASGASASLTVPRTGQTICYDAFDAPVACSGTGQDGELQAGVPWPIPRFSDNGDQTISDKLTGLIWTKDANLMKTLHPSFDQDTEFGPANDGMVTWQHALDYMKILNTAPGYLNHTDWRLPDQNELAGIVNREQPVPANWLRGQGFSNIQGYSYWSGSTFAFAGANAAWGVSFDGGGNYNSGKAGQGFVWPVRSGPPISTSFFTLSPATSTTFPATASGTPSAPVTFTLNNGGVATIVVAGITITGANADQYSVSTGGTSPCASLTPTLAAGASCTVNVAFAPTSTGVKNTTLQVASNDAASPTLQSSLTGTGAFPALPDGDLNNDGVVDIQDALRAMQIAVGLITPTAMDLAKGDVAPLIGNKPAPDGKINTGDAIVILQKVVGVISW
jgi:hypothetical protein